DDFLKVSRRIGVNDEIPEDMVPEVSSTKKKIKVKIGKNTLNTKTKFDEEEKTLQLEEANLDEEVSEDDEYAEKVKEKLLIKDKQSNQKKECYTIT
ncbi:MAG: hypothetical protein WCH76_05300, partial [Candidatus Riflemargulisbacteria bacterium]